MDGLLSCCSEERVMVFTMNDKDHVDPTILRPGRIDVHINFPLCDFSAFKTLASSHLGLKEHKLFPQVSNLNFSKILILLLVFLELLIFTRDKIVLYPPNFWGKLYYTPFLYDFGDFIVKSLNSKSTMF